jgi:hypothetical protein
VICRESQAEGEGSRQEGRTEAKGKTDSNTFSCAVA